MGHRIGTIWNLTRKPHRNRIGTFRNLTWEPHGTFQNLTRELNRSTLEFILAEDPITHWRTLLGKNDTNQQKKTSKPPDLLEVGGAPFGGAGPLLAVGGAPFGGAGPLLEAGGALFGGAGPLLEAGGAPFGGAGPLLEVGGAPFVLAAVPLFGAAASLRAPRGASAILSQAERMQ